MPHPLPSACQPFAGGPEAVRAQWLQQLLSLIVAQVPWFWFVPLIIIAWVSHNARVPLTQWTMMTLPLRRDARWRTFACLRVAIMLFKRRSKEHAQATNMCRRACMKKRGREGQRERWKEGIPNYLTTDMNLYMYTYTYIHIYIYVYTGTHMCISLYIYIHIICNL